MSFDPSRRRFLVHLTKSGLAVAVLAACGDGSVSTTASTTAAADTTGTSVTAPPATTTVPNPTTSAPPRDALDWGRVDLDFVSAYVLVRSGEVAIVDTGTSGSAGDIESVIEGFGMGWNNVGHVVLTHAHGDHIGSFAAVMSSAAGATAYAGEADIPAIDADAGIVPAGDGDSVFGMSIIATPGHTPGHISVLAPGMDGGILIAGDALNNSSGLRGSDPRFTADQVQADESVRKLAGFDYEVILFGHGDPILAGGSRLVAELASAI